MLFLIIILFQQIPIPMDSYFFLREKAWHDLLNKLLDLRVFPERLSFCTGEGGKSDCIRDPGAAGSLHNKWWAVRPGPQTHSASKHLLRACCQQGPASRTRVCAQFFDEVHGTWSRAAAERTSRGHYFDEEVVGWNTINTRWVQNLSGLVLLF